MERLGFAEVSVGAQKDSNNLEIGQFLVEDGFEGLPSWA